MERERLAHYRSRSAPQQRRDPAADGRGTNDRDDRGTYDRYDRGTYDERYANGDVDRQERRNRSNRKRRDERDRGGSSSRRRDVREEDPAWNQRPLSSPSSRMRDLREENLIQHENSFRYMPQVPGDEIEIYDRRGAGAPMYAIQNDDPELYAQGASKGTASSQGSTGGGWMDNVFGPCMGDASVDRNDGYAILDAQYSDLGARVSDDPSGSSQSGVEPSVEDKELLEEWLEEADNGELDIYTCLALSDITSWNDDTKAIVYNIICVLILQCLIPGAMLYSEFHTLGQEEEVRDLDFRIGGFILFFYSIWQLYCGSQDKCREILIDKGLAYHIPMKILWPAIFGEIMNAIVGFCLVISLYVIFEGGDTMASLVGNAVAVNFLASVDTEFCEPDHLKNARTNFKDIVCRGRILQNESPGKRVFRVLIYHSLEFLRKGGILFFGSVLATSFLLRDDPTLCNAHPSMSKVWLCHESSY